MKPDLPKTFWKRMVFKRQLLLIRIVVSWILMLLAFFVATSMILSSLGPFDGIQRGVMELVVIVATALVFSLLVGIAWHNKSTKVLVSNYPYSYQERCDQNEEFCKENSEEVIDISNPPNVVILQEEKKRLNNARSINTKPHPNT